MRDLPGFPSEEERVRMAWVDWALDELDRITLMVDLGGATEESENVYTQLMARLGVKS